MGVLSVLVAVVSTVAIVVFERGEASHTTYRPASQVPASISPAPVGAVLRQRWATTDKITLGTPVDGGTVITHDAHTVRGRDASSGHVTWSYDRSDRTICDTIQSSGVTVAIYRHSGNCDEVSAFYSSSGQRAWTRTLDEDGALFNGSAAFQVYQGELLFVSQTSAYAIAVSNGVDYWTFSRAGCSIESAALGRSGAIINMQCNHQTCPDQLFCLQGPQLLLRPLSNPAGVSQSQQDKNPDYIVWDVPNAQDRIPISTEVPSAIDRSSNTLDVFDEASGKLIRSLPLKGPKSGSAIASAYDSDTLDYVWYSGLIYALKADLSTVVWTARSDNRPSISADLGTTVRIYVVKGGLVLQIDDSNGQSTHQYRIGTASSATAASPVGSGLLVGGSATAFFSPS